MICTIQSIPVIDHTMNSKCQVNEIIAFRMEVVIFYFIWENKRDNGRISEMRNKYVFTVNNNCEAP